MKLMKNVFFILLLLFMAYGCSSNNCQPLPPEKFAYNYASFNEKVNSLVVVADTSSSMDDCVGDHTPFHMSKEVLGQIFSSLPSSYNMNMAYITFGHQMAFSKKPCIVNAENKKFSRSAAMEMIKVPEMAGGTSRLDLAIEKSADVMKKMAGKKVLLIVSDGENVCPKSVKAVNDMKKEFGEALCVYVIHAGNAAAGKENLSALTGNLNCAAVYSAQDLFDRNNMKNFIETVFVKALVDTDNDGVADENDKCPGTPAGVKVNSSGCPFDSDNDGVYDYLDTCSDTPAGAKVDQNGCPLDSDDDGVIDLYDECLGTARGIVVDKKGCSLVKMSENTIVTKEGTWIYKGVQFQSGKTFITPASARILDELGAMLKKNPVIKLEIQGHTDSSGRKSSNMKLSSKRADAVRDYLIEKCGIDSERLVSKGFGSSKPFTSNATVEGRKANRRVEFKPFN
ncbi:MAG: hypothetical protein CSA18_01830 [Deltaproteobacteria bacterium]|nr:MAG: hypothetical protein CSA18_01830 [Deltaproteobacteria bacterium]